MEQQAYSIDQFCAAHGFGRSTYFKLRKEGKGPREIRVATKPIITVESARAWREKMATQSQEAGSGRAA